MTADRVRRMLGVLMVALALVGAGCGEDSATAEYKADAKAIIDTLREDLASSSKRAAAATSDTARIRAFAGRRKAAASAAASLHKLEPPRIAEHEHDNFVIALRRYA